MKPLKKMFCLALLLIVAGTISVRAQSDEDEGNVPAASSAASQKQLASRDPLERQRAAEDLARLASAANRKLLEGYRLQEKNARVKLALDWALYRTGKKDALFAVVNALDSSRAPQANSYLTTLETPEPLYLFLERANGNTQMKLLEVLAKIGDASTLDRIKTHSASFDPKVAEAARLATSEIEQRLREMPSNNASRPRQVGKGENSP
jgi:nucleotide-binding universal stress UspA family protein